MVATRCMRWFACCRRDIGKITLKAWRKVSFEFQLFEYISAWFLSYTDARPGPPIVRSTALEDICSNDSIPESSFRFSRNMQYRKLSHLACQYKGRELAGSLHCGRVSASWTLTQALRPSVLLNILEIIPGNHERKHLDILFPSCEYNSMTRCHRQRHHPHP